MEQAEHRIDQTVAVQLAPLFHKLWGKDIVIIGEIPTGAGIQLRAAISADQAVELVGNGIFAGFLTQTADVFLDEIAGRGISGTGELIVFGGDGVKPGLLGGVVDGADILSAFKKDVLKIMGNTCVGTVFSSGIDHHSTKNLGLSMVFVEPHFHPIPQTKLFHFQ